MAKYKLSDVSYERSESIKTSKQDLPIVGLEHIVPGDIILHDWHINNENTFTKRFYKGDVLFGRRRAYLKKAVYAPFDGVCSGDITVIAPRAGTIEPRLLPFIIQNDNLFNYAIEKSAGSLSPRVKWKDLANFEFYLPDLEKQSKIANILLSVLDTINSYKKLISSCDNLAEALFREELKTCTKETVNLGSLIKYLPKSKIKAGNGKKTGTFPFYTSSGEQTLWADDYIYDDECLIIATGGKASVIYANEKFSVSTDNFLVKAKKGFLTKFLYYYLLITLDVLQLGFRGVGIQHIGKAYLNNINVPKLDDVKQNEIVLLIDNIFETKKNIELSLLSIKKLYQSITNKYINTQEVK